VKRVLAAVCLVLCACAAPSPPSPRLPPFPIKGLPASQAAPAVALGVAAPNLILISLDTLRADHLSAYGYERPTSPAIDRLAASGVLFERAFSHAPHTAQAHMSLFTSLYPAQHGVENLEDGGERRLSPEVPTLAELLRRAGYRTRALTGGGNVAGAFGFDRGFDEYDDRGGDAAVTFGQAAALLETWGVEATERPFFLFVHTFQIHDPYVAAPAYVEAFTDPGYAGRIIGTPQELRKVVGKGWENQAAFHDAYWSRADLDDPRDVAQLRGLYDASIRYTDEQVGSLLEAVDRLGLGGSTWIVLLSDHGEAFGEHGGFLHEDVHVECLRVPLVVRAPPGRIAAGIRVQRAVRLIDVMPTLLEQLGLPVPEHLEGETLGPWLAGLDAPPRPLLAEYRRRGRFALHNAGLSLIGGRSGWRELFRDGARFELYDLALDPREEVDVAERRPSELRALRGQADEVRRALQNGWRGAPGASVTIDERTRRQLESLGYLGR